MRAWMKRLSCGLLAALMLLSVTGCKKGGSDGENSENIQLKVYDGEEPEDLGGYVFKVIDFSNNRWNRENNGTPYYDAWHQVLNEVEGLYNCKIELETVSLDELFNKMQPEVMAGEKFADLVCATQWAFGKLIGANLLRPLNTLEDVNWDNAWWNQNIREISTINKGTMAANGSFIFDAATTYVMFYNEDIWNELQLPDPYDLVNSGKWTIDRMREYCKKAMRDNDGDGAVTSKEDRWGLITPNGDFSRALYFALGGHFFQNDENGHVQLACKNEKTYAIVEKMYTLVQQDKSVCRAEFDGWEDLANAFLRGNGLFLSATLDSPVLKDMESDWGAMPLPKMDESQEQYLSGVDHNSTVCGVPSTNDNVHEVGVIMEALGRHATILEDIYWPDYENTFWRHAEDAEIVANHVVKHGQYDLAVLMQNCNNAFSAPMSRVFATAFGNSGNDFSSYIESVEDVINTTIAEYFDYTPSGEDSGETTEPTDAAE